MAAALALARSSSRSRHCRPPIERSTPRKSRRALCAGGTVNIVTDMIRLCGEHSTHLVPRTSERSERRSGAQERLAAKPLKILSLREVLRWFPDRRAAARRLSGTRAILIQMELLVLPVLGPDPAHRAGHRAHDYGLGLDHVSAELHAAQHRAVGDPGRREQAVSAHHVLHQVFLAR